MHEEKLAYSGHLESPAVFFYYIESKNNQIHLLQDFYASNNKFIV